MWQKFKDQLPAVIVTLLFIGGLAYWLHTQIVSQMSERQQIELTALRDQTNAELRATTEETRHQIDAINTLLKDAISQRSSDMFMNDEELAAVNSTRIDELAGAIAVKMQPLTPPPSAETAELQETAQIDRVSSKLTERIQPLLAKLSDDQTANRQILESISNEISDQLSVVLTTELAKNQTLNNNLSESQAIARDSLGLSQELAALYLSSFENKGTRILTLPANVIKDASKMSIVNSTERKQKEEELLAKLAAFQVRLDELQAKSPPRRVTHSAQSQSFSAANFKVGGFCFALPPNPRPLRHAYSFLVFLGPHLHRTGGIHRLW
ncbi:MAG: hypothetical protein J6386_22980 [Candidatus Synoicihabitans palmerolidicus]|nr:hypothetical protein [Candidatus Synoicihabitans palmerolidicus]